MKRWPLLAAAAALTLGAVLFQPGCATRPGPGLQNFGQVADGLYRGAQPTDEGLDSLKAMGVRTVVNLRHFHGHTEERACLDRGIDYVWLSLESSDAPSDADVKRFLDSTTDGKKSEELAPGKRTKRLTKEKGDNVMFETRDAASGDALVHRSHY